MSFLYKASQCPSPTPSITTPTLSGCSSTNTTAPTWAPYGPTYVVTKINQIMAALAGVSLYGGNGFGISGRLVLTAITGLAAEVTLGHAYMGGVVELPTTTGITLSDNTALGFVWLIQGSAGNPPTLYDSGVSTTLPGGWVGTYIGNYTTVSGSITAVDFSSVCYINGGLLTRTTGDRCSPTDTPNSAVRVETTTLAGLFKWNGDSHSPFGTIAFTDTITTTLVLDENDLGLYDITPSGGDQTVNVPGSPIKGNPVSFVNPGSAAHNLILTDAPGTRTIATLPPGYYADLGIALPSATGGNAYPNTVTPVALDNARQVTFDAASNSSGSGTSSSQSHTNAGNMLVVSVIEIGTGSTVLGVTFNGVAMGIGPQGHEGLTGTWVTQYYLPSPAIGAHNIVASFSAPAVYAVLGVSLIGASPTIVNSNSNDNTSGSATVAATSALGSMVVDGIACLATPTSTTTLRSSDTPSGGFAASSTSIAVNPTMGYTLGSSAQWVISCLTIQAA